MKRRLVHRIPVRVRHYWKLLATCAATLLAFTVVFSTVRVAPLVTSAGDESGDEVSVNIAGATDLFDATRAHNIKITYRTEAYEELLDSFWKDGEKEYLEADLTIDGTTVPSVGIRLKGNSTLQGITRNGEARQNGFGGGRGAMPQGAMPQGGPPEGGGFRMGGGGGRTSLKTEEPETLPWLIRFDEFVEGRRYQGHREIAVRVGGMGGGAAVLNEAVSLNVLAAAGEVTQRYAYTSFTVNDRPTTARLIVEHPDENFADAIGGNGVLYKSMASSQFTDQGDDPTEYADDFKQINKKGSQDLQPVIDLITWVNSAGDAEFDEHLDEHVDVTSLARYAAIQNLLVNFDDMAGPGRNYYLWYDLGAKRFSVVGWDYNLTLSGSATQDPAESVSMGGGMRGGGGDFRPPEGMEMPPGMEMPAGGRGGFMSGHKLKERFLASAAYKDTYRKAYKELFNKIYGNASALNAINAITEVIGTVDGANAESTATEAENLRTLITERTRFLVTNEIITG
ncbi:CotH kinase family protein [Actinoplanes hulinensis]|uniref:CotH kinase family protein n=1 Tax=Actinoplanes hulinensis TaxID=1144547 RepID=A0ABS7AYV2_9ACTN|nr:CotH kinase family protein [Actinoplanes hulinensis]MBW6433867.1 CotH kinase family protein [Actinoplanes hulinensis]